MPCTHELIFARKLTFALAAFLAGTVFAPAFAQPPQLVQKDGLLVLPNVRLETAAIPVNSAVRAAPTEAGLRAYRDEKTGQLRSAFPEELIVEAVEAPRVNDPAGATVILLPNGGTRAILDESFMSNAIVHRDANGKLHMECVPGSSLASALLRGAPSGVKEHSHVH